MSEEKNKRYNKISKIIGIIIGIILVLGISYAVFRTTDIGKKINRINTADFNVVIENEKNAISLENSYPMTDEEGLQLTPYTFDVANKGTIDADYDLYLEVDESVSTLPSDTLKYYLTVEEDNATPMVISSGRILSTTNKQEQDGKVLYKIDSNYISYSKTNNYKLYLWIDYDATIEQAMNKTFEAKVKLVATQVSSKKKLVKKVDVSEKSDGSAYAYMYADKTVVIKGNGNIASNLSNSLVFENEKALDNYKKVLLQLGCNEDEVNAISSMKELEEYYNSLDISEDDIGDTKSFICLKEALEEMGYDVSNITDIDSLENYAIENGFFDEEGEETEKGLELEKKAEEIENNEFTKYYSPKKIVLEEGITNVPSGLYSGNKTITTVEIPEGVTSIDSNAFNSCEGLTSIELPNSVTNIGSGAFMSCKNLASIKMSNSINYIGSSAFYGCTSLNEITIPNSAVVSSVAFYNWSSSQTINIDNTKENVDAKWNSAWKAGCSAQINYLRS